jgi:biopolymer transport protein ExbB
MGAVFQIWDAIDSFLYAGGSVLLLIACALVLVWTLIAERLLYFWRGHDRTVERIRRAWSDRGDHSSWYARQVRRGLVSEARLELNRSLHLIRTLVAMCPLLGLLGTVTGMVEVFEVMALLGNENPRAMAAGIYRATLPTMAGMVAALSALFFSVALQSYAQRAVKTTAEQLGEE